MNWIVKQLLKFTGTQKFLSAQLDITNACNLKCIHCYQPDHSGGGDLPIGDWRKILDQYEELANKLHLKPWFCISGGEPTISPLFPAILAELHSRWPAAEISVLTNGAALSDRIVAELARYKAGIQISIDGPDRARHDRIRGSRNFDKAVNGIKVLQKAGLNVTLQAVLSYRTAPWINEFFQMASGLKVSAMNFTRFIPQGKGESLQNSGDDRPLVGPELRDAYAAIVAASAKKGVYTSTNIPLFVLISPGLGAHGKFGFQGLIIDYQGNLKVSSRTDFRLGNILETGLEELFLRHPIMKDLRAGNIEGCGSCRLYDKCGGDRNASFAAYGSFLKRDPGCWLVCNSRDQRSVSKKTVYTVGVPNYWETLTPPLQHSLVGDAVIEYQTEPLVRMGEQGIIEPLSAKSWELSADHRKLIFKIDTSRRFSDGSFLRAEDFKRSWEDGLRMAPKSSNSSLADALGDIGGYSGFKKKGEIEGVRVIGKDILVLEFEKPVRLALKYLSVGRSSVYKTMGGDIIGTGPYVITEKNKELTLTPNLYYAGKKPALKEVKIVIVESDDVAKKIESGEIDAYLFAETVNLPGCDNEGASTVRCARGQEASHSLIYLNGLKGHFFSDPKHRFAFQALMAQHINVAEKRYAARGFMHDSQSFLKFQAGRVSDVEAQTIIRSGEQYIPRLVKATKKHPLYLASTAAGGGWIMDLLRKDGIRFTKSSETDFDFKDLLKMYYKTWEPDLLPMTASVSDGDPDGLYHLIGRRGAIFSPLIGREKVCDGMESGRRLLDLSQLPAHYQKVSRAILEEVPYVHLGYFYRRMAYNSKRLRVNEKMLGRNNPNILLLKPR